MKMFLSHSLAAVLIFTFSYRAQAEISVGQLSKEGAREMGITMKSRGNGDAGVKVWIEFKKVGFLEKLTYTELRMNDGDGKHLLSAMLEPRAVVHGQPEDLVSISFSADPDRLENCAFMMVAYGSDRGDVGYLLRVKDFLDLEKIDR